MIHVDDVTGVIQRIGTFVHNVDVLIRFQHIADHLQGIEVVHRCGRCIQLRLHLIGIDLLNCIDAVLPGVSAMDVERFHLAQNHVQRSADTAHYRSINPTVAVHFFRTRIQLDELGFRIPFLALTVVQEPVQPCSYQHHHICLTQYQTSGCGCTLGMVVGKKTFRHRHRKERNTCLLNELLQLFFHSRISGSLTDDNQRFGSTGQEFQSTLDSRRTRYLHRNRINRSKEGGLRFLNVHGGTQHGCGDIQIYSARSARQSSTDGSGYPNGNVLRTVDAIGSLHKRFGDVHLVESFIIALLKVDDVTVARTADLNHRKTVDGSFGQCSQPIEKTRSRNRKANARLTG